MLQNDDNMQYKVILFSVDYDASELISQNIIIKKYNKIINVSTINDNILVIINNDHDIKRQKIIEDIKARGIPIINSNDRTNISNIINHFYRIRNKLYYYDFSNIIKIKEQKINIMIVIMKTSNLSKFHVILNNLIDQKLNYQTTINYRIYDNNVNKIHVPKDFSNYYYKNFKIKYSQETIANMYDYVYKDIHKNMNNTDFIFVLNDKHNYKPNFLQQTIDNYMKKYDLSKMMFVLNNHNKKTTISPSDTFENIFVCNKKFFVKYVDEIKFTNLSLKKYNDLIYETFNKDYNFYLLKISSLIPIKFYINEPYIIKNKNINKNIDLFTDEKKVYDNDDDRIKDIIISHFNINKMDNIIYKFINENTINITGNIIIIKTNLENFLYDFNIQGFASNADTYIYLMRNNMIELLKYSQLHNNFINNINFIDNAVTNITHIIIKNNDNTKIEFERMTLTKVIFPANRSIFERPIINIDKKKSYKKNNTKIYNVAVIADVFTYDNLNVNFNLFCIDVNNPMDVFINGIDFIFIESAWHGINDTWRTKISNYNNELEELFEYAQNNNIPKVFYNKEDPVHFDKFIKIGKHFINPRDCVLTTAAECIEEYKKNGCVNVIAYPFCCEPTKHNPINRKISGSSIIFPGSYYQKFQQRCDDTDYIFDKYYNNVDVYDRQYLFNKMNHQSTQLNNSTYQYPDKYLPLIKGSLTYNQLFTVFDQYQILININTVNTSETMFSRRVTEACATGLCIISNPSIGMEKIFGNNIIDYKNNNLVTKLINNEQYRQKIADNCYKIVMKKYTYKHLLNKILININMDKTFITSIDKGDILILIFIENHENITKFNYFMQNYNYVLVSKNIIKDFVRNIINYDEIKNYAQFKYYAIMNEYCTYDNEYIENMLLPTLYTDAKIIGKSAYYFNVNKLVNAPLEHRFTNRLNVNTIIFKLTPQTKPLINEHIINNMSDHIKSTFDGKNMYSCDKYDFHDDQIKHHYIFNNNIDLRCVNNVYNSNKNTLKIIMCQWKRTTLIPDLLKNLDEQYDMNFELYIWNNSGLNIDSYCKSKFNIYVYDSIYNVGGIGRFYMVNHLLRTSSFDYVIFFDDDQILPPDFVSVCRKIKKKNTCYSWYGRIFYKNKPYTYFECNDNGIIDYRTLESFDYGGTGGMIIDTPVFLDDEFYFTMPKEYLFIEDLWLSYYLNTNMNYKFLKLPVNITNIRDGKNQCDELLEFKNIMLDYCRENGWNV